VTTETVKIARMQQRRGLKQDLPKPLRPGEIGFATDSRQVYIGADTSDPAADVFNKTAVFESTQNSQSTTLALANVQMIKFTVPTKSFNRNEVFNGTVDSVAWTPESFSDSSNSQTVFSSTDSVYTNIITGNAFGPADVFVTKNGITLTPANSINIASGEDYFFSAGTSNNSAHALTFRSPPSSSEIGITYYGNAAVIQALYGNITGKIGVTGVDSFYTSSGLNSVPYRQLSNNNIRVSPDTGVGFIGLEFKHLQVATDVKQYPTPASTTNLGAFLASRNSDAVSALALTANATNIVVSGVTAGSYNLSGNFTHTLIETGNTAEWLYQKVLSVSEYDTGNSIIVASLPANASSVTKLITRTADAGTDIRVYCNTSDIEVNDSVYIIDTSNVANANAYTATVSAVDTADGFIEIDNSTDTVLANTGFTAGTEPKLITRKNANSSNIVITSNIHGLQNGNPVRFSSSLIDGGSPINVFYTGNANTFIVNTTSVITADLPSLTFTPVISNTTVTATPVLSADLSAATSLDSVVVSVNDAGEWLKVYRMPNESARVYATHSDAAISSLADDTFSFRLHDDANLTVSNLGLTPGVYNRQNSTVKAKLEDWLTTILSNGSINIFTDVLITEEFNNDPGVFNSFNLNLDSTLGEITFDSRTEVRDFTTILNNIYFNSVNPDIKGLMNIKTNIEFLTLEALAAGSATTDFTATEAVTIASGVNVLAELGANIDSTFSTFFIEYSMKDGYTVADNAYRRIGTLMYTGDSDVSEAIILDNYSDIRANITGNVTFTASISGSDITITANNTLVPTTPVTMNYIVRRWS
jgi:hypothetical protein